MTQQNRQIRLKQSEAITEMWWPFYYIFLVYSPLYSKKI